MPSHVDGPVLGHATEPVEKTICHRYADLVVLVIEEEVPMEKWFFKYLPFKKRYDKEPSLEKFFWKVSLEETSVAKTIVKKMPTATAHLDVTPFVAVVVSLFHHRVVDINYEIVRENGQAIPLLNHPKNMLNMNRKSGPKDEAAMMRSNSILFSPFCKALLRYGRTLLNVKSIRSHNMKCNRAIHVKLSEPYQCKLDK